MTFKWTALEIFDFINNPTLLLFALRWPEGWTKQVLENWTGYKTRILHWPTQWSFSSNISLMSFQCTFGQIPGSCWFFFIASHRHLIYFHRFSYYMWVNVWEGFSGTTFSNNIKIFFLFKSLESWCLPHYLLLHKSFLLFLENCQPSQPYLFLEINKFNHCKNTGKNLQNLCYALLLVQHSSSLHSQSLELPPQQFVVLKKIMMVVKQLSQMKMMIVETQAEF